MADQPTENNNQQIDFSKKEFPRYLTWSWVAWIVLGLASFILLYILSSDFLAERTQNENIVSQSTEQKLIPAVDQIRPGSVILKESSLAVSPPETTMEEDLKITTSDSKEIIDQKPVDDTNKPNSMLNQPNAADEKHEKTTTTKEKVDIASEKPANTIIKTKYYDGAKNINISWDRIEIDQFDAEGQPLKMVMYVAAKELAWKFESTEIVKYNKKSINIHRFFQSDDFASMAKNAEFFVCVGTASEEGPRIGEESRAMDRAGQLAAWVQSSVPDVKQIYTLNLGQYFGEDNSFKSDISLTEYQRRVVLISVTQQSSGIQLEKALIKALSKLKTLSFHPDNYSSFMLNKAYHPY